MLLTVVAMAAVSGTRANVILILTDDQGYGEIGAHGNPLIKTPNLDRMHAESVRLTDFHVDPTCSPTRSALLTGRYSTRTGVWHTINGRSMMRPEELTMAELFKANGYRTAMIGKWHLGDNYPCRPNDQGFEHTVWHLAGGVGNGPDYWGNDYFDDTYLVNGELKPFEGYCTDVWFREAAKFVAMNREQPFFLYLATNAPHGPFRVEDRYAEPHLKAGMPENMARFYGMIANLDENLGKFRKQLADWGLAENTLLIFMTDNGTTAGWIDQAAKFPYYDAGMRGWKGSAWDGGHRVPCFLHWPKGGLAGGREVSSLTAHIDLLPTLADLLGFKLPEGPKLDGVSLGKALTTDEPLPARTLFVHVQRADVPPKWVNSVAMRDRWRLIDGRELYDLDSDPGQQRDVAAQHPALLAELRGEYEKWWASLEGDRRQTVRYVAAGDENPMILCSHDWLMAGGTDAAWHQNHIRRGDRINGRWALHLKQSGNYEISLYRWAPYLNQAMDMKSARVEIAGETRAMELDLTATHARFELELPAGDTFLQTWLVRPDASASGAYYVRVRYKGPR